MTNPDKNKPQRPTSPSTKKTDGKVQGEGDYEGARDYDARVGKFVSEKKGEIQGYAKDAEKALEGAEGKKLRSAEEQGKARAKH